MYSIALSTTEKIDQLEHIKIKHAVRKSKGKTSSGRTYLQ